MSGGLFGHHAVVGEGDVTVPEEADDLGLGHRDVYAMVCSGHTGGPPAWEPVLSVEPLLGTGVGTLFEEVVT